MLLIAMLLVPMDTPIASSTDPLSVLINIGVAGVVIVLLITGKLRTGKEVEHLLSEIEKKDAVIDAFQSQLTGHTLPALARSAQAIEAIPSSERSLYIELRHAQDKISDLTSRLERLDRGEDR